MRCHRPMLAVALGLASASACRSAPAPATKPVAAPPSVPLAEPLAEPLDRLRLDCAAGELDACDEYELQRALCLQFPEGPVCDHMRARAEIPPKLPPLADVFGCRPTLGPIGPQVMICLDEERLSIRYASGLWDQWRIQDWQHEDTVTRVVWVVAVIDGATLWITPVPSPEPASPLAGFESSATSYHVVGEGGLLHATVGARDATAEDELGTLPSVEEVCRSADVCEHAIAAARRATAPPPPPPPSGEWGEEAVEVEVEPPSARHTLLACHERWFAAAQDFLARGLEPAMPIECGTEQRLDGWLRTPVPPYPWPELRPW